MILFVLAYLAGILTIVSPCILPVLPFVFARAGQPFMKNGLPLLIGMAATFAAVATLAAIGGGWAVQANEYGRIAALALLALFGVTLLFPSLAERMTRPLVAVGARLSASADRHAGMGGSGVRPSLLLGVATGLLWAPCAGPILGLILTGAALHGASARTSLLLATYAAGAGTSLGLALLVGGRVFALMKHSLGVGEWIRRGLGIAVLAGVVVIASGLDTSVLTQVSLASTTALEQGLLDKFRADAGASRHPTQVAGGNPAVRTGNSTIAMKAADDLPIEDDLPPLSGAVQWLTGAVQWLNSPPLTDAALKGKVVLIDFWTYSCINCLRELPYVRAWADKYKDHGLVVIGVHAPEFAFERNVDNVKRAVAKLKLDFPIAIDNDYAIWRAFDNEYWPAEYFVDARGRIRHHQFGEGDYAASERIIQELLVAAGQTDVPTELATVNASGAEAASDAKDDQSHETYIGYGRADHFVSPGGFAQGAAHVYTVGTPALNQWGLAGDWTVAGDSATLDEPGGGIVFRFHARDLHLVPGPPPDGKPIRFEVRIDGAAPSDSHGVDVDAQGQGVVTGQRLYQLIRQDGTIADHTFEIRFLDPGVQAYSFAFG
jgi:cytochrome c biogenesis protein CcdA/thiol-disulfide isomerase/thioredoxin